MFSFTPLIPLLSSLGFSKTTSDVSNTIDRIKLLFGLKFDINEGPWIAGGSVLKMITNQPLETSDIDIFFPNSEKFNDFYKILDNRSVNLTQQFYDKDQTPRGYFGGNVKSAYKSGNAISFETSFCKIQLIRYKYYPNVLSVLGDFDMSICQFATDGENIVFPTQSLEDVKNRRFHILNLRRDSSFIPRLYKYMLRGYSPAPGVNVFINSVVGSNNSAYSKIEEGDAGY
jgi:hypothetical protein